MAKSAQDQGQSELRRRVKLYRLTPQGHAELQQQTTEWARFARTVSTVLVPAMLTLA